MPSLGFQMQNPKQRVLREAFLPAQPRSLPRQYPSTKPRRSHLALAATASSPAEQEEDLWQYPDRDKWYLPKFAAADQPDWNAATFVAATQLAPGIKEVTLNIEVSRERVPLRNAYKHVGQFANVRVNGSAERMVPPSSPPVSAAALRDGLLRVRGDMTANETKTAVDEGSVRAELSLFVRQDEAPEVFAAAQGDVFEVGAFQGGGLELRGPIAGVFAFPTVVIFVEGDGIATARALVAAASDAGGLNFPLRQTVKVYYKAPNQASLCYADELSTWGERYGIDVITSTRDSFQDMFDDDDTLIYEPESTAAIILTGSEGGEAEDAAAEVCKEASIEVVVRQAAGRAATVYLRDGKEALET